MRKYETIFVIDSLLKSDEIENNITKYEKFISANGGQIETLERWGKKRLAFEIKKRQYGYYVFVRFDGTPSMIKPLEREYRLNESILRYKTIVLSTMALKALAQQQTMKVVKKTQDETEEIKTTAAPSDNSENVELSQETFVPTPDNQPAEDEKKIEN